MTNEQIVVETKRCEDAGLLAQISPYYATEKVQYITCLPKKELPQQEQQQNIKKSNITTVNVEIPPNTSKEE